MSWQNVMWSWTMKRTFAMMRKHNSNDAIDVAQHRAMMRGPSKPPRLPKGWQIQPSPHAALPGEWIAPNRDGTYADPVASPQVVLYLHGGGYYFCSPLTHRNITCGLAREGLLPVLALDYPLAPEHPFPQAVHSVVAACEALYAQGTAPEHLILAGDSAGGGLVLATLMALRDAGKPLPSGAILFSPWTDLTCSGESFSRNVKTEVIFTPDEVRKVAALYLQGQEAHHAYASPVFGDYKGLPPLFFQASSTELLLDDTNRVVDKAQAAGVDVHCKIWPKLPHVWQILGHYVPEAIEAMRDAMAFARLLRR